MSTVSGFKNKEADLNEFGIKNTKSQFWNLTPSELYEHSIKANLAEISDTGALVVNTGEFTGRSPQDRFIVEDDITRDTVNWGNINIKFSQEKFDSLYKKVVAYLEGKDIYVRDAKACAEPNYSLKIRVITELPWANLFAGNMFIRLNHEEISTFEPSWTVIAAPGFKADESIDGTRQHNFAILNFTEKTIIIGGTAYTGEIKKGIFSVLNFVLPQNHNVLSMHCSANIGQQGDTALFFGLSGTGKTTLSADPNRNLIGDDEHGWAEKTVFNFEGGCYAKVIDLSPATEPEIYGAIKFGSILENVKYIKGTRSIDFTNTDITPNTRVSYPIEYIANAVSPSVGFVPKNIFFLTYDAFGVIPPIAKLTEGQAMYHFISGYTSKVAGTEEGVLEPKTTFSACFGSPFLPLHPTKYAKMLGDKMSKHKSKVWLINTGLTGGPYRIGKRISLPNTRALITSALNGELDNVEYENHPIFGFRMPKTAPHVENKILNPRNSWSNPDEYDKKATELAKAFIENFKKFKDQATPQILDAAPKVASEKVG